jgi:hypothetical protein
MTLGDSFLSLFCIISMHSWVTYTFNVREKHDRAGSKKMMSSVTKIETRRTADGQSYIGCTLGIFKRDIVKDLG